MIPVPQEDFVQPSLLNLDNFSTVEEYRIPNPGGLIILSRKVGEERIPYSLGYIEYIETDRDGPSQIGIVTIADTEDGLFFSFFTQINLVFQGSLRDIKHGMETFQTTIPNDIDLEIFLRSTSLENSHEWLGKIQGAKGMDQEEKVRLQKTLEAILSTMV